MYRQYSRSNSAGGNSSENLPPRTLSRIAREIRDLHKNPPEGIKLVVDSDTGVPTSLGEVLAEMEGPQGTPYETKFFRVKLVLSADFPASPPRGFFLTKIYHPNVDVTTGAICVNTLKKDWTAETTFAHVLSVIRCLLIVPFPESSLNDEAGKLFMESYEEYAKRARLLADVHGRPFSTADRGIVKTEETITEGSGSPVRMASPPPFSSDSRPNPLRKSNSANSNGATNHAGSKGASGRMNKKKSLKRL